MRWTRGDGRELAAALLAGMMLLFVACRGDDDRPSPPEPAPETPSAPEASTPTGGDVAVAGPDEARPTAPTPDVEPDATPAPAESVAEDVAEDAVADGAEPTGRPLEPFEVEAQVKVLTSPRDVLDVFLTTKQPRLRHALLSESSRHRITPEGLDTFLSSAPGLLDLPLPLAPLSYEAVPIETDEDGVYRFLVRRSAPSAGAGVRTVAYYALRREEGGARVAWSGRDLAAARLLVAKGAYKEAEELLDAIRKRTPYCGDCEELLFWAKSRREGGRKGWKPAGEHAERAVRWEPAIASRHNALGVYYRNMRQYERSRGELEEALKLDPRSPAAGNLALLHEHQGRDEDALRVIDEYVAREPDELWPRLTRCRVLRGMERDEDAVAACEAALDRQQPGDESAHIAETHYLLAGLLSKLGKKPAALEHAEKALEHRPGYWVYVKLRDELAGK